LEECEGVLMVSHKNTHTNKHTHARAYTHTWAA
jgi:hypothetical protein